MENKLKSIIHFSLAKRLTIYFLLFGFITGHIVFLVTTSISEKIVADYGCLLFTNQFNVFFESKTEQIISEIVNQESEVLKKKAQKINYVFKNIDVIEDYQLFFHDHNEEKWRILEVTDNNYFRIKPIDDEELMYLEKTWKRKRYYRPRFLFKKTYSNFLYFNLVRPDDHNHYILKFTISKISLLDFIKKDTIIFSLSILFIIVASFILGNFFAFKIARPIEKITVGAMKISEGDYDTEFNIKRQDEIGILAGSLNIMAHKIKSNISEINHNLKTMETMNQIDKAVLSSVSKHDLMKRVVTSVSSLFHDISIFIVIKNEDKNGYEILSLGNQKLNGIFDHGTCMCNDQGILFKTLHKQYQLVRDPSNHDCFQTFHHFTPDEVNVFLNTPLVVRGRFIGGLIMTRAMPVPFNVNEISAATMLTDQVGVALQSVKYFEEKEDLLLGILLALTKAIDAKSKWTAGHSERVAHYVEAIAMNMGLTEEEIRKYTISAVLHDIGKIAIPENILDKPGKLTHDEYAIVKQHPGMGAKIIGDIPSYNDILPGIKYHHEHWDGGGYPEGLQAKEIPLESRIITVADVFDAITDDRPYRSGMPKNEAIVFLKDQKRKLFDGEIVDLFINILENDEN